jgi:hypothetical protein
MRENQQAMFKSIRMVSLFLLFLLGVLGSVAAQGAPEQINDALADLNTRLGRNLTLNDINWRWSQAGYDEACPDGGDAFINRPAGGYQFLFFVDGDVYDYRVSVDRSLVLLCSVTPEVSETPTGAEATAEPGEPAFSNRLCPTPPADISYIQTRLTTGIQARVLPGLPNRLRAEPSTQATQIGEIPGGAVFTVTNGPTCDVEGYVWWEVNYDGSVGFTAEGRTDLGYLIEPLPPLALPTGMAPITPDDFAILSEVTRLQGNFAAGLAWSQETETDGPPYLLTLGDIGSEGVWVYAFNDLTATPRIVSGEVLLTDVAIGADPDLALVGSENGGVRFWDIGDGASLVERAFLQGHDSPITAVAFKGDGSLVASSGGRAYLREDQGDNLYAISLWNVDTVSLVGARRGHTESVTGLAFTPDGTTLISGSLDGAIRFWPAIEANAEATVVIEVGSPVRALALSPDGSRVAAGLEDGTVVVWDAGTQQEVLRLEGHTAAVNAVTFSPDGTLLASGGEDAAVIVWDLTGAAEEPAVLSGHTGAVDSVTFSPDGAFVVSLGTDNTIRIWGPTQSVG